MQATLLLIKDRHMIKEVVLIALMKQVLEGCKVIAQSNQTVEILYWERDHHFYIGSDFIDNLFLLNKRLSIFERNPQ